ncbi:exosortase system-associated protein, TIGR04073 family [bacterium]|nr:exosortase system-associated protein, TIGR04073 family [bacterium]
MLRNFGLSRIFCLLGMVAMLAVVPQFASAQGDEDVYRESTDIDMMFHKLGRGVSNLLLGWVEVPKCIAKEWHQTDPFTGTIVGFVKGVGWGVARTLAGAYEIISFPFPVPREYAPIMYPEFVLPSVWGDRLPLYQDEFLASEANAVPAMSTATGGPTYGDTSARSAGIHATISSRSY